MDLMSARLLFETISGGEIWGQDIAVLSDFAGQINPTATCAPEIGVTGGCPVVFDPIGPGLPRTTGVDIPLVGTIVQVRLGGRALLATGDAIITGGADSIPTGNASRGSCGPSACPQLNDTGVPFVYTDVTPRNNFRYFYTVTAFDVNSFQSAGLSASIVSHTFR